MRNNNFKSLLGLLVNFLCCTIALGLPSLEKTPNVILIITDDQGYGDMACLGNPTIKTPNMDQFFLESTRLTDFHVSPTCAPTRAALMTGRYSNRTGVWHTIGGRSLLSEDEITLADVFAANGYATGIFGKWHLGDNYPFRPQDRGFQEVLVHGAGGVGQGPDYWDNDYFDDTYFHNGEPKKYKGYCTDVWFENATKFIDDKVQEEQPFFCYISTNAPHSPFFIENEYADIYRDMENVPNPAFNGMITNIDDNLGKLMKYLKRNGLEENTILIFMTDNGTSAGVDFENGKLAKGYNAGMKGKKGSMYEGGHRVPFFIRWKGSDIASGKDVNQLTAHIDIFPTMLDMLDLKMSQEVTFDGASIKTLLYGQTDKMPKRTLVTDSQRLEKPVKWRQSSVMQDSWRLINGEELYDIAVDPGQENNLANTHPDKFQDLRKEYEQWWEDLQGPMGHTPRIVVCSPEEPVTVLRTHDMHMDDEMNIVAWNQIQIRNGMTCSGWYELNFPEAGNYKISLRRWPPETSYPILSGLPAKPGLPGTTVHEFPEGVNLPIQMASISLNNKGVSQEVSLSSGEEIVFEVPVDNGKHQLRAWFTDENEVEFAAFYVIIEKI